MHSADDLATNAKGGAKLAIFTPSSRSDAAHALYQKPNIIAEYVGPIGLQPPEEAIFQRLRPDLAGMDVLDIGVGAGRTARAFGPAAKSYLGVDYAEAMIARCKADLPALRFRHGDVRRLDFIPDESCDLVLFSFNGIDHLDDGDRRLALMEMHRVLRPRGWMVFSSHNSNWLAELAKRFTFQIGTNLRKTLHSLKWSTVFKVKNWRRPPASVVRGLVHDGTYAFAFPMYYTRPDLAVDELHRLGMQDVVWAGNEDSELMPANDPRLATFVSMFVYFMARKP